MFTGSPAIERHRGTATRPGCGRALEDRIKSERCARRSGGTAASRSSRGCRERPIHASTGARHGRAASVHRATSWSRHSSPRVLAVVEHGVLQLAEREALAGSPSVPSSRCWTIRRPSRVRSARAVRSSPMMRAKPSSGCVGIRQPVAVVGVGHVVVAEQGRQVRRAEDPGRDRVGVGVPLASRPREPSSIGSRSDAKVAEPSAMLQSASWRRGRSGSSRCRRRGVARRSRRRSCSPTGCPGTCARSRRARRPTAPGSVRRSG